MPSGYWLYCGLDEVPDPLGTVSCEESPFLVTLPLGGLLPELLLALVWNVDREGGEAWWFLIYKLTAATIRIAAIIRAAIMRSGLMRVFW